MHRIGPLAIARNDDVTVAFALDLHGCRGLNKRDETFRIRSVEDAADRSARKLSVLDLQLDAVVAIELLDDLADGSVLEVQPSLGPGECACAVDFADLRGRAA